jgi:DNA-binding beta-propeller fold protein YncE
MKTSVKYFFLSFSSIVFALFGSCVFWEKENHSEQSLGKSSDSLLVTLEPVWETDTLTFITPENVTYDPDRKVFYVSSLNRSNDTENDGYISIIKTDGTVEEEKWTEGLTSPLGNDFHNNFLFVNDKGNVVKIDLKSGEIIERIPVKGAIGLNGMDIDEKGNIYSADSEGNKIFKITPDKEVSVVFEGEELNRPNGVLVRGDELFTVSSGGGVLNSIDLKSGQIESLVEGIGQADGIILLDGGHFLTSSWKGEVYFISKDMKVQKILDLKDQKINAADIGFIPEEYLLVVPTFHDNRLMAYKLKINKVN